MSELFGTVSAKVAAAVFGLTTAGTSVAAATGHLPGDLQDQAAVVADTFGVDLPDSGDHRQDDVAGQDAETQGGDGTDTDDAVIDTLNGDSDATPEDGEEFGEAVSSNASANGEDLGRDVASTASDGASDEGGEPTTVPQEGEPAEESTVSDDHRPTDPPSDPGDAYSDDASEYDAESNPGGEHRPE